MCCPQYGQHVVSVGACPAGVGDDMVATARAGVVADVGAIRCCLQKQVELRADLLQLDFGGPARLLCLVAHRRAPSQRRRRQFACASESSLCSHARGVALVACPSGVVSGTPAVTALGQPTWRSSDRLRAADLQLHRAQLRLRWEGVSTKPSLQAQIGQRAASLDSGHCELASLYCVAVT